eukprot:scaffold78275_cov15-Tisochrysis_lutea.AAC.1
MGKSVFAHVSGLASMKRPSKDKNDAEPLPCALICVHGWSLQRICVRHYVHFATSKQVTDE